MAYEERKASTAANVFIKLPIMIVATTVGLAAGLTVHAMGGGALGHKVAETIVQGTYKELNERLGK